jgi:hypothetical protein
LQARSYEIGTNKIFDDRAQEMVVHDHTIAAELSKLKQEPDRVFGLRLTRNFQDILSQSIASPSDRSGYTTIGQLIRTSPFKPENDPLLFPFLILEAKKESNSSGFEDIQAQTAFPIWSLLRLQENLQSHLVKDEYCFDPLVWFLASRGDVWRVYGCYVTKSANNESSRYVSIFPSPSLKMSKGNASLGGQCGVLNREHIQKVFRIMAPFNITYS